MARLAHAHGPGVWNREGDVSEKIQIFPLLNLFHLYVHIAVDLVGPSVTCTYNYDKSSSFLQAVLLRRSRHSAMKNLGLGDGFQPGKNCLK